MRPVHRTVRLLGFFWRTAAHILNQLTHMSLHGRPINLHILEAQAALVCLARVMQ
jgi:hypothetical protein